MKYNPYAAWLVVGLALGACSTTPLPQSTRGASEMWVGESIRSAALDKAIVVQRTLYPYHFVDGAASLNQLGERDLAVLATHFSQYPGDLTVYRGNASDYLHRQRVRHVADRLRENGVDTAQVVTDQLPGGDGISSERVLRILDREQSTPGAGSTGTPSNTEPRS